MYTNGLDGCWCFLLLVLGLQSEPENLPLEPLANSVACLNEKGTFRRPLLGGREPIANRLSGEDGIVEGGDNGITTTNTETLVLEELLGITAGGDGSFVGPADVVEVIADAVNDDVGVEGLLLVGRDGRLVGLEGELSVGTTTETTSEEDGGVAGSEVDGTVVGGGIVSGGSIVSGSGIVSGVIGGVIGSSSSIISGIVSVASVGIASITGTSTGTGGEAGEVNGVTSGIDSIEVGKALLNGKLGNRDASSIEGGLDGSSGVGVLNVRTVYSGVKEREDTAESLGGGERSISAKVASISSEGVEVLLSGNDANGGINDLLVITELGDDVIGKRELGAGAGTGEEDARNLTREGTGSTGVTEGAESLDGSGGKTLLAESSLDVGDGDGEDGKLVGRHLDGFFGGSFLLNSRKSGYEKVELKTGWRCS